MTQAVRFCPIHPMLKTRPARHPFVCMFLAVMLALSTLSVLAQQDNKVLRSGWYPWDPYQYELVKHDIKKLTGLDVQLLKAIFERMGHELKLYPVSWEQHQQDIREGKRDVAGGAFRSQAREAYAHYPIPLSLGKIRALRSQG